MSEHLLYQCYGNIDIINECKYALLRIIHMYRNEQLRPQIVIYTDQPAEFAQFAPILQLQLKPVDASKIKQWRGKIDFVHRVKIEMITDAMSTFGGKLLYMDTDTFLLQTADKLFELINPSHAIAHQQEGTIQEGRSLHMRKWRNFLTKYNGNVIDSTAALHTTMYNAGVLGLHQSHMHILNDVLQLCDALYPLFKKHTVEQFSFSFLLKTNNINITDSSNYIFHYWDLKEFRQLLSVFFAKYQSLPIEQQAELATQLDVAVMMSDKMTRKRASLGNFLKNLRSDKWKITNYPV